MSRFEDRMKELFPNATREEILAICEQALAEMEADPPVPEGECFFCHKETTNYDLCYGCNYHVCPECTGDPELVPMGEHGVLAHKAHTN